MHEQAVKMYRLIKCKIWLVCMYVQGVEQFDPDLLILAIFLFLFGVEVDLLFPFQAAIINVVLACWYRIKNG